METIIAYDELLLTDQQYGGKIEGLKWLLRYKYLVPQGFIIPFSIVDNIQVIENLGHISYPLICRSSVECEDGKRASFAGIFASKIINNHEEIYGAISDIRQSARSEHAIQYADRFNIKIGRVHILVQSFIVGDISGVYFSDLFGRGPYIEYVYGDCSKLVDGVWNAKSLWYSDMLDNSENYHNMLTKLFYECNSIAGIYGMDVDIEWVIKGDKIYFLQIRPIIKEISK